MWEFINNPKIHHEPTLTSPKILCLGIIFVLQHFSELRETLYLNTFVSLFHLELPVCEVAFKKNPPKKQASEIDKKGTEQNV